MPRPSILLDCDPGHDDAVAIITAANTCNLLGITTVAGNAPLSATTRNALIMRDLLRLDVPVHSGADRPLLAEPKFAAYVHGESGLDGADLPEPTRAVDGTDAARFIIDTVRATSDPVWLVPVGPLTNIAVALRLDPTLVDRIAGISLMGGGTFGNRTPAAEFNIWADPEAAAIVYSSGAPIIMAGLDVTHQFIVDAERVAEVRAIGGTLGNLLADLFDFFRRNYMERHTEMRGAALHDPCAVLAVTHPELFETSEHFVTVETTGLWTTGMTVIDQRDLSDAPAANCVTLDRIDSERAWAVVTDAIRAGNNPTGDNNGNRANRPT